MIKFEKVSFEEYLKSVEDLLGAFSSIQDLDYDNLKKEWESIQLPKRATKDSAGYDFFAPRNLELFPHDQPAFMYPTGIKFITDRNDLFLMRVPRSGLGCKKGVRLLNTVGVIDSGYWHSDNEGHIKVKMSADESSVITKGTAYMQGIIIPFFKTDDDDSCVERNGGFGSTGYSIYAAAGRSGI